MVHVIGFVAVATGLGEVGISIERLNSTKQLGAIDFAKRDHNSLTKNPVMIQREFKLKKLMGCFRLKLLGDNYTTLFRSGL